MAKKRGRKTLREEVAVFQRYQQLAPRAFAIIESYLNSDDTDKISYALDWLKPAYAKMIPQQIGGVDGGPLTIQIVDYAKNSKNTASI